MVFGCAGRASKNNLQANTTGTEISVIAKARVAQCDLESFVSKTCKSRCAAVVFSTISCMDQRKNAVYLARASSVMRCVADVDPALDGQRVTNERTDLHLD
jgi:hypothetical protein